MDATRALELLAYDIAAIRGRRYIDEPASDAPDFLDKVPGWIAALPTAPDPSGVALRRFTEQATILYERRDDLVALEEANLVELIVSFNKTVREATQFSQLRVYQAQPVTPESRRAGYEGTTYFGAILRSIALCYDLLRYVVQRRARPKTTLERLRDAIVALRLDYDDAIFDPAMANVSHWDIDELMASDPTTHSVALQFVMRQVRLVADALNLRPRPSATAVDALLTQIYVAVEESRTHPYWIGVGEDAPEADALYLLYQMATDLATPRDEPDEEEEEEEEEEEDEDRLPVVPLPEEKEGLLVSPTHIQEHRREEQASIGADVTFLLVASQRVAGTLDDVWTGMDKLRPTRGLHPAVLLATERHDGRYATRSDVWPVTLAHLASAARVDAWKREFDGTDWPAVCRALVPLFLWFRHVALWSVVDACARASVRWQPIDGGRGIVVDASITTEVLPADAPLSRDGMLVELPPGRARSDEDNDAIFLQPSTRRGRYAITVPLFPQAGAKLRDQSYPLVAEEDGHMPTISLDDDIAASPVLFLAVDGEHTTRVWRLVSCPSLRVVWHLLTARITDALPDEDEEEEEADGSWEPRFLAWLLDGRTGGDVGLRALLPLRADVIAFAIGACTDDGPPVPLPASIVAAVRQTGLRAILPPATQRAYYFLSHPT